MTRDTRSGEPGPVLDERTERALAALLAIPAPAATGVRERSPARRRPRRQYGPVLDLGAADADGPDDIVDGSQRSGAATD